MGLKCHENDPQTFFFVCSIFDFDLSVYMSLHFKILIVSKNTPSS